MKNRIILITAVIVIASVFLFSIHPVKLETGKQTGFPLTVWIVIVGGFLLFVAGNEFWVAWTSGKSEIKWVSFKMLAAALGLLTVLILVLESFVPGWWNNVWDSQGKLMITGLGIISILWYIFPGTGATTIKLGKSLTTIAGLAVLAILLFKAVNLETPSFTEPAPQAQREEQIQTPAPYPTPAEAIAAPAPHWEEIKRVYVQYNKWTPEDFGFNTIVEVPSENEKYLIEIEDSDFQQFFIAENGKEIWTPIGPEGITYNDLSYEKKLPLYGTPHNRLCARIIKFGDNDPEYLGKSLEKSLNQPGTVEIKIFTNMMQNTTEGNYPVANNFVRNKGGDWIIIKKLVAS